MQLIFISMVLVSLVKVKIKPCRRSWSSSFGDVGDKSKVRDQDNLVLCVSALLVMTCFLLSAFTIVIKMAWPKFMFFMVEVKVCFFSHSAGNTSFFLKTSGCVASASNLGLSPIFLEICLLLQVNFCALKRNKQVIRNVLFLWQVYSWGVYWYSGDLLVAFFLFPLF